MPLLAPVMTATDANASPEDPIRMQAFSMAPRAAGDAAQSQQPDRVVVALRAIGEIGGGNGRRRGAAAATLTP